MAISNFHISFDSSSSSFKPGDDLKGKVIMDVWATIDIKFVEFVISGKGTLRMFKGPSTFIERPRSEVYVDKKILLIGPSNGKGVTLHPGRYVTSFQYTLPEKLPPSVHQVDLGNGSVFDISYSVQAHVCDRIKGHVTSPAGAKVVKILKATKRRFTVLPTQTWQTIPGALDPIVHAEQVLLFHGAGKKTPTSVVLSVNRGVHPVGDKVQVNIEVISSKRDRVQDIGAELEQELLFDTDLINKFRRVLIKAVDETQKSQLRGKTRTVTSSFTLPLPANIVPSYIPHCRMIKLKYTLKVTVKFKNLGGKLIIGLPIVVAQASPSTQHDGELPLFNKPIMQFPYFSKSPNGYANSFTASEQSSRDTLHKKEQRTKSIKSANVTTKYKTIFNCCGCCLLCLGFGILESWSFIERKIPLYIMFNQSLGWRNTQLTQFTCKPQWKITCRILNST